MSKNTDERTTPLWFYQLLDKHFHFTLDAAASDDNALCEHYYTIETDGLASNWRKSTFCNPPYSRGEIIKWVLKAADEMLFKQHNSVLLLPGDVSTAWFKVAYNACTSMWAFHKRLKFNGMKDTAKFGTLIVLFGFDNKLPDDQFICLKEPK